MLDCGGRDEVVNSETLVSVYEAFVDVAREDASSGLRLMTAEVKLVAVGHGGLLTVALVV